MALLWLKPLAAKVVRRSEETGSTGAGVATTPIKARGVA
jgi:hypothetical protein